jgi:general L-amino acid transport system permease protein
MRLIVLPQALRVVVPPMTSQYLNLTKNSSLAVIIGYPDLVSIANTSINQNGQALEVILIIMAVYLSLNLTVAVIMNAVNARVTRAPR